VQVSFKVKVMQKNVYPILVTPIPFSIKVKSISNIFSNHEVRFNLYQDDVRGSASGADLSRLLRIIFQSLPECLPTPDTAEIIIESVSAVSVENNRMLKKIKKGKKKVMSNSD
jgi:hypothetical protein